MPSYREQIRRHVVEKGVPGRPLRKEDFEIELANEDEFDIIKRDILFLEEAVRIIHIDIGRAHAKIRRMWKIILWLGTAGTVAVGYILREMFIMVAKHVAGN